MRLAPLLLACAFLLAPVAAAEAASLQVAGMYLGTRSGVAGAQWDDNGAVGMRYWMNATEPVQLEFLATVCLSNDARTVHHCERYPLAP